MRRRGRGRPLGTDAHYQPIYRGSTVLLIRHEVSASTDRTITTRLAGIAGPCEEWIRDAERRRKTRLEYRSLTITLFDGGMRTGYSYQCYVVPDNHDPLWDEEL